jgi:serine/threonine-protein kinase
MSLDEEWEQSGLVGKVAAGRYLIVSELAADARRTLYEAENVELGMRVTLGVVRADGTPTEQRLANGEKLRSLKQAGLVSVLDVGKLDSGELYVATERPEGKTLRTVAGGKPMDARRALLIVRQVLEALAAAHAVGAIHGDVNPQHILITPGLGDDRVKLIDFGVAALTGAMRIRCIARRSPHSAWSMVASTSMRPAPFCSSC